MAVDDDEVVVAYNESRPSDKESEPSKCGQLSLRPLFKTVVYASIVYMLSVDEKAREALRKLAELAAEIALAYGNAGRTETSPIESPGRLKMIEDAIEAFRNSISGELSERLKAALCCSEKILYRFYTYLVRGRYARGRARTCLQGERAVALIHGFMKAVEYTLERMIYRALSERAEQKGVSPPSLRMQVAFNASIAVNKLGGSENRGRAYDSNVNSCKESTLYCTIRNIYTIFLGPQSLTNDKIFVTTLITKVAWWMSTIGCPSGKDGGGCGYGDGWKQAYEEALASCLHSCMTGEGCKWYSDTRGPTRQAPIYFQGIDAIIEEKDQLYSDALRKPVHIFNSDGSLIPEIETGIKVESDSRPGLRVKSLTISFKLIINNRVEVYLGKVEFNKLDNECRKDNEE